MVYNYAGKILEMVVGMKDLNKVVTLHFSETGLNLKTNAMHGYVLFFILFIS